MQLTAFDVVIVGGGPAGLATALALLQKGRSALVIERSGYDHWRVGETLPAEVQVPLRALGVWDRFLEENHTASFGLRAIWGGAEVYENDSLFSPYGSGWHVDRRRFDAMLAQAVEQAGGTVHRAADAGQVTRTTDGWRVSAHGSRGALEADARLVVDATGRAARIARAQGSSWQRYDRLVGLVGILTPLKAGRLDPVLALEAVANGWWYSVPLPDGAQVVAYMTDEDELPEQRQGFTAFWTGQLAETGLIAERVQTFEMPQQVHVRNAGTGRLDRPSGPGWLAVGDAAQAYDPLSAQGVYKAVTDGIEAGACLDGMLKGNAEALDRWAERQRAAFDDYLLQRARHYRRETRWPASRFWLRRQPLDISRTTIQLDPRVSVQVSGQVEAFWQTGLEGLLSLTDLHLLCSLCQSPRQAHELIADFRRRSAVSDDRLAILALQVLVANGVIAAR